MFPKKWCLQPTGDTVLPPIPVPSNGSRHHLRRCQSCFENKCTINHSATETILLSLGVSRKHLKIWSNSKGLCFIQDLNSTNGVYVNGRRIPAMNDYTLGENDVLTLQNSPNEAPSFTFVASTSFPSSSSSSSSPPSSSSSSSSTTFNKRSSSSISPTNNKKQRTSPPTLNTTTTTTTTTNSKTTSNTTDPATAALIQKLMKQNQELQKQQELNEKQQELNEQELTCKTCLGVVAFPVTVSGCKCDNGVTSCYKCWTEWEDEKGNTCMICHENVNKTYHKRDMVLGNMADNLMLTKDNQDEDRIEYNARKSNGQLLWKEYLQWKEDVSSSSSSSTKSTSSTSSTSSTASTSSTSSSSTTTTTKDTTTSKGSMVPAPITLFACAPGMMRQELCYDVSNYSQQELNGVFGMNLKIEVRESADQRYVFPEYCIALRIPNQSRAHKMGLRNFDRIIVANGKYVLDKILKRPYHVPIEHIGRYKNVLDKEACKPYSIWLNNILKEKGGCREKVIRAVGSGSSIIIERRIVDYIPTSEEYEKNTIDLCSSSSSSSSSSSNNNNSKSSSSSTSISASGIGNSNAPIVILDSPDKETNSVILQNDVISIADSDSE